MNTQEVTSTSDNTVFRVFWADKKDKTTAFGATEATFKTKFEAEQWIKNEYIAMYMDPDAPVVECFDIEQVELFQNR